MEPRVVDAHTTRWDLGILPPLTFIEAKLNPTRREIVAWLADVRERAVTDHAAQFQLAYGRGGGPTLVTLDQLIRNAIESGSDETKFRAQLASEGVDPSDEVLTVLGSAPQLALARISILPLPDDVLQRSTRLFARQLVGEPAVERLIDFLFHKFAGAIPYRRDFSILDLVADIVKAGIQIYDHPTISFEDLGPKVNSALMILQLTREGLPLSILAEATGSPESETEALLEPLAGEAKMLLIEQGLYSVRQLPYSVTGLDRFDLLAKALNAILQFIERRGQYDPSALAQVGNALALAKACEGERPDAVADVFMILEKYLKDLGDKHVVLNVAELSLRGARDSKPRTQRSSEREAHALVCGRSWVYQRINRLPEARIAAEQSLHLGKDIPWDRNTAFCLKCIGRLCRLEAERAPTDAGRVRLFQESVSKIQRAIGQFSSMSDFGPEHPQVGDCYSLLGRTFLSSGRLEEAADAVRTATRLIVDRDSKDFLDLTLLDGDLQASRGERQAAEDLYGLALQLDPRSDREVSEMRARAYFKRGLNFVAMGKRGNAKQSFENAAAAWQDLDEDQAAAEAEWEVVLLDDSAGLYPKRMLEAEAPWVRVRVVRDHQKRAAAVGKVRRARREVPATEYWVHLIKEAKRQLRIEVRTW